MLRHRLLRPRALRDLLLVVGVGGLLASCQAASDPVSDTSQAGTVDTARGERLFDAHCAVCHGELGAGTAAGPPLVHPIYEPSHHGDEAFQRAVAEGVVPHHWEFGPMPAISGLERAEVADIIAYVRELQREAGIE